MKRSLIVYFFALISAAALFASGKPEPQLIREEPVIQAEELDRNDPAIINIVETYPDQNIYNAIGRNTVKSGQPEAIYTVFNELRRTYDPIIVNWEFMPLGEELTSATTSEALTTSLSQELIDYARDHIDLDENYEVLETYDPSMASIIIMVEASKKTNVITPKVSMTTYNFNYRLITPTDQIVIGKNNASIVKETFRDMQAMQIGEKVLVDVWY